MEVSCRIDLKPLIREAEKAERALRHAFHELVDLAYWAFERLIELTPESGRSKEGKRVADSWELKFLHYVMYRELAWSVLSEDDVIGYLEYGTRDHWVYPRSPGGVLHWIDPTTGGDAFSRGHMVRGIKPVGMTRITLRDLERKLRDLQAKTALKISN